jgi:transcriptional regulator with XRE-family HTH domain
MASTQMELGLNLGLPQDAVDVNGRVWFRDLDGNRAVFVDQAPFYCYPLADPVQHRFCAIQLVEAGLVKVLEVCSAFGIHDRAFSRYRSSFRKHGFVGLVPGKAGRKSLANASLSTGITERYQRGKSTYDIAEELGISPSTVQRILRDEGVPLRSPCDRHQPLPLVVDDTDVSLVPSQIAEPQFVEPQTEEPQIEELQTVEATSVPYASPLDRFATTMGWIEEAPVEYRSADGVPCAGVLLGLVLLEETHLVEEARSVYGGLKNGWYGLRSLLWTLVVMALLRIKRPEQLKYHDPAALGAVLGLPRAAEIKTVRRKLEEISLIGKAAQWHRGLACRRAEENPAALATLYIDGHVRAYHGVYRIGQTRVSRLKRVMRAEEDYWVHQAQGQPLLVVHESVDSSFHEALCNSVLPEIREVIGDRRVRIVFDREGWSRELFSDLLRLNFDFITYRKGNYEPLPESDFETISFKIPGQPDVKYDLAESTFQENGWPELRLIALKKKNGGQTHVVASGQTTWESLGLEVGAPDPPAAEISWIVLGRWSQENWFKYMRQEYALDVLVDYTVELDDQEHPVVNPQWRDLDRQVTSARNRLQRAQAKYAKLTMQLETLEATAQLPATANPPSQLPSAATLPAATLPGDESKPPAKSRSSQHKDAKIIDLQKRYREQAAEVSRLSSELDRLRAERKETPRKIPLREASDRDKVRLSYERKLFTDTVKLSAYEIETRLYTMLGASYSNSASEGRGIIQSLLSTSGDIRVKGDLIEVHLDQLSAPRYTLAMQSLCQQLNAQAPRLPESNYQLRFHIKPRPTGE